MAVFDFITGIFKPVADLVDELHLSGEEKLAFKERLMGVFNTVLPQFLQYEAKRQEVSANVVLAEAAGHSWIQRNWRPLIMLMFGVIVANNYIVAPYLIAIFSAPEAIILPIPTDMWSLMKIGLGGYTVGRSAEKIAPTVLAYIQELKTKTEA